MDGPARPGALEGRLAIGLLSQGQAGSPTHKTDLGRPKYEAHPLSKQNKYEWTSGGAGWFMSQPV